MSDIPPGDIGSTLNVCKVSRSESTAGTYFSAHDDFPLMALTSGRQPHIELNLKRLFLMVLDDIGNHFSHSFPLEVGIEASGLMGFLILGNVRPAAVANYIMHPLSNKF